MKFNSPLLFAVALALPLAVHAGSYVNNFTTAIGTGTPYGSTAFDAATASLILTQNAASLSGAFVLPDLDPTKAIKTFDATFTLILGPGSGNAADGASFSFGTPSTGAFGEEGATGAHMLTVSFDIYDNTPTTPENKLGIRVNNTIFNDSTTTPDKTGIATPVIIHYDAAGLDVKYGGVAIYTDFLTPAFTPVAGDVFQFGARTGGETALQRIDNVSISTTVPEPTTALLAIAGLGVLGLRRRRQ